MDILTFEDLQSSFQGFYHNGNYSAALELATQQSGRFPEHQPLLDYWRIALSARLGDRSQAIRILRAAQDSGFWYSEVLLRNSDSLRSLQGSPEFEQLVLRNRQLQEADQSLHFPVLVVREQGRGEKGGPPCPLMVALHDNGSNARDAVSYWKLAASVGWLVALPQSTQAMWKDAFVWNDRDISEREVRKHIQSLKEQYAIDPGHIVIAGQGMGGEIAIWLALGSAVPARGFVAISPNGPLMESLEDWIPLIQEASNPRLRGYFLIREEDSPVSTRSIQEFADRLQQVGIACDVEAIPRLDLDISSEIGPGLLRALEFIEDT